MGLTHGFPRFHPCFQPILVLTDRMLKKITYRKFSPRKVYQRVVCALPFTKDERDLGQRIWINPAASQQKWAACATFINVIIYVLSLIDYSISYRLCILHFITFI